MLETWAPFNRTQEGAPAARLISLYEKNQLSVRQRAHSGDLRPQRTRQDNTKSRKVRDGVCSLQRTRGERRDHLKSKPAHYPQACVLDPGADFR
jgi:hypothetical protein